MCISAGVYYHSQSGNMFSGEWKDDRRCGIGTYVYVDGSKYTGNVLYYTTIPHSRQPRFLIYIPILFYFILHSAGQWIDNMMQGKGRWDFACGAFYRGQVKMGIKHGKGIYTWPNGNCYKGMLVVVFLCYDGICSTLLSLAACG